MDEQFDFRALLLKLQDCLSVDDRRRLHFLMGDMIPRQIRDDPTLGGTLHLLETLFDHGRIDTQDYGYLIHAFREIGCHTAVKRLKEHQGLRRTEGQSGDLLEEIVDDVDDKIQHIEIRNLMLSDEVKPRSGTFESSTERANGKVKTYRRAPKKPWLIPCHVSLFLINLISIVTCIIIVIIARKPTIPHGDILVTWIGQYHGESIGGQGFNDAKEFSLTFNDRITEITGGGTKSEINYISFSYSNGRSALRGTRPGRYDGYKVELESNEYIDRITVYTGTRKIHNPHKLNGTSLVVGLLFQTNRGNRELFGSADGEEKKESFKGYHLGYVRGRAEGYIDAIQFIWYKKTSRTDTALLPDD